MLIALALVIFTTNVTAGEVGEVFEGNQQNFIDPQQAPVGAPLDVPQGVPFDAPQGNHPMPAPLGTPFPDGDPNLLAPQFIDPQNHPTHVVPHMDNQGVPIDVPHTTAPLNAPHFPQGVPHGAPIVVPHGTQTPCNNGVVPQPAQPGLAPVAPQQGLVPQS